MITYAIVSALGCTLTGLLAGALLSLAFIGFEEEEA